MAAAPRHSFHALTPDRFPDLERLFGPRGACGGCWCMWWRLPRAEFTRGKGEGNRRALEEIVRAGTVPGVLAYADGEPIGWCAVEPREAYPRFLRSRTLAPVDDEKVWSITCFYVARAWRGRGVTSALVGAAVAHARRAGARVVEAYPVDPGARQADAFVYTGLANTFRRTGFEEVARRSPTRPIVRRSVGGRAAAVTDARSPASGRRSPRPPRGSSPVGKRRGRSAP